MRFFRRIPIETLVASGGGEHGHLKKVLNVRDLIALGVGAIIGAGIFATLGAAASGGENSPPAGPAVTISIIFTAVACGFCALCYAELAGLVPLAGSAYTYSYATLGELPAWIIGWDLIIEYAVGNIAVAISWAAYFRQLMAGLGVHIPSWLATDYRSAQLAPERSPIPDLRPSVRRCVSPTRPISTIPLSWECRLSATCSRLRSPL